VCAKIKKIIPAPKGLQNMKILFPVFFVAFMSVNYNFVATDM